MFNPTLFNVDGLKIRILGMFFKPLTLRRSLLELFENRRRQNLGRFTALPAAIFRPIFLPFAGPCWWYFWFQMLQFYIWHSILLVVEPERTVIVRSGLVKKPRQDSTVLIQSALLRNEVAQPLPSFLWNSDINKSSSVWTNILCWLCKWHLWTIIYPWALPIPISTNLANCPLHFSH